MSEFAVDVRKIETVKNHPHADRLDLATVEGLTFQFVVERDTYVPNDLVAYFPIDSIIPEHIIEILGLTGKLSGKAKTRVKTVKLRGEISQGLVLKISKLEEFTNLKEGDDITEALGVTKYEPPIIFEKHCRLVTLPPGVGIYDIEGCERNKNILQHMIDLGCPFWISEKLEGSNFSCTVHNSEVFVSSRKHAIIEDGGEHTFWKTARREGLIELASKLANKYSVSVTVRGEIIGPKIRGNIYKLLGHSVRIFDILMDGHYLIPARLMSLLKMYGCDNLLVPTISIEPLKSWLGDLTIQEASTAKSLLNSDTLREGVVLRPLDYDVPHPKFGRLIIKQRSPEYLAGSKV